MHDGLEHLKSTEKHEGPKTHNLHSGIFDSSLFSMLFSSPSRIDNMCRFFIYIYMYVYMYVCIHIALVWEEIRRTLNIAKGWNNHCRKVKSGLS